MSVPLWLHILFIYIAGMFLLGIPMARYTFRAWKDYGKLRFLFFLLVSCKDPFEVAQKGWETQTNYFLTRALWSANFYPRTEEQYESIGALKARMVFFWPLFVVYHVFRIVLWVIFESAQRSPQSVSRERSSQSLSNLY